jgi:hypothetical protein
MVVMAVLEEITAVIHLDPLDRHLRQMEIQVSKRSDPGEEVAVVAPLAVVPRETAKAGFWVDQCSVAEQRQIMHECAAEAQTEGVTSRPDHHVVIAALVADVLHLRTLAVMMSTGHLAVAREGG